MATSTSGELDIITSAPSRRGYRPAPTVLLPPALHIVREGDTAEMHAAAAEAAVIAPELFEAPREPYAEYKKLGLGPPPPAGAKGLASKLIVSSYRTLGFAILTLIVALLVGYIFEQIFYYASSSWVAPTIVSPTDEKVVALRTELAAQENTRDKIAADLDDADRQMTAEGAFQTDFAEAIRADLAGRKAALGRVKSLVSNAYATRRRILASNSAFAGESASRLQKEIAAGLVDRNGAIAGSYQLAQISSANLSLAEREAELDGQAADLEAQTQALDGLLAGAAAGKVPLGYDVLKIKHDYEASKLAYARAKETHDMLKRSLARQDEIVTGLSQSSYLRALADHAIVAAVPYDNLGGLGKDTPLYGCHLNMVLCHRVGRVLAVLPGEVQFKHPHRDADLRGQLVELELDDAGAARDKVLFAGGRPLGI